jgi:hypothetical protein
MVMEGGAPVFGKAVGAGLSLAGKGLGKTVQAISSRTSSAAERANLKAGELIIEDLAKGSTVSPNVKSIIRTNLPEGFAEDVTKLHPYQLATKYPDIAKLFSTEKQRFSSLDEFIENIKPETARKYFIDKLPRPSATRGSLAEEALKAGKEFAEGVDPKEAIKALLGNPSALASLKMQAGDTLLGRVSKVVPQATSSMKGFLPGVGNEVDYISTKALKDFQKLQSGDPVILKRLKTDNPDVPVEDMLKDGGFDKFFKSLLEQKYSQKYSDRQWIMKTLNDYLLKVGFGGASPMLKSKIQNQRHPLEGDY